MVFMVKKGLPGKYEIDWRSVEGLIPYARNSRTHSKDQVAQIAASIREFGWTNPILVDGDGTIIAGHGRVMAARKLGETEVPCIELGHLTEAQKRAYVIADNQLALNAGWDAEMLKVEIAELVDADFDLGLLGFDDVALNALLTGESEAAGSVEGDEEVYSRKIEAPIYKPSGDCPSPDELYDDEKSGGLIKEIRAAKLPDDIAVFLEKAAERHTVFDFRRIADFYASSDAPIQRLMERSALVIIDFDKAIENGFVRLTKRMGDLAAQTEFHVSQAEAES
jgi:hypothetical protein